jgi:RNase P protein component
MMSNPKGVSCHSPYFHLRATPSTEMPMPTASAFGPPRRPPKEFTPFAILTTIKGVSKRAVQRNRVRTRFKEAVRLVLTRDARAANDKEGEIAVPLSQTDEAWAVDLLLEGTPLVPDMTPANTKGVPNVWLHALSRPPLLRSARTWCLLGSHDRASQPSTPISDEHQTQEIAKGDKGVIQGRLETETPKSSHAKVDPKSPRRHHRHHHHHHEIIDAYQFLLYLMRMTPAPVPSVDDITSA